MDNLQERIERVLNCWDIYVRNEGSGCINIKQLIRDMQARIGELETKLIEGALTLKRTGYTELKEENAKLREAQDNIVIRSHGINLGKSASGALIFYQKCLEAKDGDKIAICTTDRNIILTASVEKKSGIVALDSLITQEG